MGEPVGVAMIPLSGIANEINGLGDTSRELVRVRARATNIRCSNDALLVQRAGEEVPDGSIAVAVASTDEAAWLRTAGARRIILPEYLSYLRDGDIFRIDPKSRRIRVLYRR